MKNTKEIQSILSAIYCINHSKRDNKDKDIELLCEYAFHRLYNSNTNLLILSCVGKTEQQILEEVNQMMFAETNYKEFIDLKKEK
jgi:hypothetical protein